MTKLQRFIMNGFSLALATIFMRTVAVVFNAYVSSSVGAEGMGLFSLVSSVYGFFITFATSGIGLATMRLVAEAMGRGDAAGEKQVLYRCLFYALLFGGVASFAIFFLAEPIGVRLLGDARTVSSLRLFSISLLPIAMSSVFAGFYNAKRRSGKNALTQVVEQVIRIFLTVALLIALLPKGVEYACIALVAGGAVSELLSFIFMAITYGIDQRRIGCFHIEGGENKEEVSNGQKRLFGKICSISLPVAFSTYVRSGLTTLEHVLIPRSLMKAGGNKETALSSYGALHGMAIPILLYPASFLSSFTGLLLPEVAESLARGEKRRLRYIVERSLSFALMFAFLAAGALFLLSGDLGDLVYKNREAGFYIAALVPLVPVMYLDTTVDNILKGIGEQFYCMCVNVIDAGLSVILVLLLLPRFGALGYVGVLLIAEVFNFSLSVMRLYRRIPFALGLFRDIFLPILLVTGASLLTRFFFLGVAPSGWIAVMKTIVYLSVALLFFVLTGVLGKERRAFLRKAVPENDKIFRKKRNLSRSDANCT